MTFSAKITGTGSAFPERAVSNRELVEKLAKKGIETSDDWIVERTGIRSRYIVEPGNPNEHNSSLGLKAARMALEVAGRSPLDIDQIVYGTCSPDTLCPSSACWLQEKLGAKNASAMDVNAACSGFVYALNIADQSIRTGQSKVSLVVGCDILSSFTDWDDRSSCILFGDGGGAVIVEQTAHNSSERILSCHLGSDGSLAELFLVPAGGSRLPVTPALIEERQNLMQMKGREIFKEATRTLAQYAQIALDQNGISLSQLNWLIPHQANLRIIEAVIKRLGFPIEKTLLNIDRSGNTSAGTVPSVLDENVRSKKIKKGDLVLLDVFGAGLTYGSVLIRWAY